MMSTGVRDHCIDGLHHMLWWCRLPSHRTFPIPVGVSLLAGIGFTMAILFAGLAFPE